MKSLLFAVGVLVVFAGGLLAQSTIIKLPTTNNSSSLVVTDNLDVVLLKIFGSGGFYIPGNYPPSALPVTGTGARLTWDPSFAAFRAGVVDASQWDAANTGTGSIAIGHNTTASGAYSMAMGDNTTASGSRTTAMGSGTTASAGYSTAIGYNASANGPYSISMGSNTTTNGDAATAMGYSTTAGGLASIAMGYHTTANGFYTTAIGSYVSTNGYNGSCVIGDASTNSTVTNSSAYNEMTMRFDGGYRLFSDSGLTTGVHMDAGVSGWTNICDRNKKQSFRPIDGEELLKKIRTIPITEWSYKGSDLSIRYIGPMAQDFYSAFHLGGKDSLGINSISIDGVNMAGIQALEKRTAELQLATAELEKRTNELQKTHERISALETSLNKLSAIVQTLVDEKKNVSMNVVERKEQ